MSPGERLYLQQSDGWLNAKPWKNLQPDTQAYYEHQAKLRQEANNLPPEQPPTS